MPESQPNRWKLRKFWTLVDYAWYRRGVDETERGSPGVGADGLPERHVTFSQVVAYNMAHYRRAAGLSQEQFGVRLGGWSAASVSAAERSWDGRRVRKFDADEVARIARAAGDRKSVV